MAGFSTAVTGLKASTTMLDVAGNNIANSSTVGFKSSRTEFGDIYATAVVGAGSANVAGSGVTVTDIAQDFKAGTIEFTNNNLDLAINGSGFFQLDDGQGGVTYTRAGAFELNKEGFIVSKNGKFLQGYGLDADGNRLPIGDMAVTQKESPPKATENIDLSFNIDDREDSSTLLPTYDKDEPGSFTWTTTDRVFDSLGNEHTIKYNFAEQRPVRQVLSFSTDAAGGAVSLSGVELDTADFDADGYLILPDPAVPGDPGSDTYQALTNPTAPLKADDRIDLTTLRYDSTSGAVDFELKGWATDAGDVVLEQDGAVLAQTNTKAEDRYRDANEVRVYSFAPAAEGDTITIAGEDIQVGAGDGGADKQAELINAQQARILERNPAIESVSAEVNAAGDVRLVIRYKADEGNITDPASGTDPYPVTVAGTTQTINWDDPEAYQGDNSYMGVYRMYAYLNNTEQLDIGKLQDPGEGSLTEPGPILVKFNPTNGLLSEINGEAIAAGTQAPSITIKGADPANDLTEIKLDLAGSTQFASASIVNSTLQDGYTKGDLIGVTFASSGEMIASFSNGQNQALGVVAIASFENQSGLQPSGDTEWTATLDSGDAVLNPPGTGLNGTLRSAALEASNVDLSAELVKLIEGQRNFQANSKTLETLNTVTQAILQI
ncbi:flagellar hook-basal body complex protein [Marinobacterium weihaiense]|uniref:Flagellar hook protein FlgE n=1 Tax=Marinobacterium weihaiense TaxID=2851016 RepID=A0ABS6MCN8_9GAMM|nr:flagellar hook-basal body complex protein [Marinobacterium weihaiense]MBV0934058.1 flagellar hook-basal body complex protein [Marinobacterium weihaiense]